MGDDAKMGWGITQPKWDGELPILIAQHSTRVGCPAVPVTRPPDARLPEYNTDLLS